MKRLMLAVAGAMLVAMLGPVTSSRAQPPPQNIVLILTDDQVYGTLRYMPDVQSLLMNHGVTFINAFDNNPLCCPTRATILTGLTSGHNGVWTNSSKMTPPPGGFAGFVYNGDQNRQIFGWLKPLGYQTALIGKFLNGYFPKNDAWILPGVDDWHAMNLERLDTPETGCQVGGYYGTCYSDNGYLVTHPKTEYSTTATGDEAVDFIESANPSHPLFLYYAPRAPHQPTTSDPMYRHACPDVGQITSRPTFNKLITNGPAYMDALKSISARLRKSLQDQWRRDCQTLLSVDDQVARIVTALKDTGRLGNTLIVFTSDNGYAFGQHRWVGKEVPYDEAIRVPVVIRDDAVIPPALRGTTVDSQFTSLDYTPTFLQAAGTSRTLDGQSLFPLFDGSELWVTQDPVLIEHGGNGKSEDQSQAPSYCGVRASGYMYAQYSTGEEELYDMSEDPWQQTNVASSPAYASVLLALRADAHTMCDPPPPGFSWAH